MVRKGGKPVAEIGAVERTAPDRSRMFKLTQHPGSKRSGGVLMGLCHPEVPFSKQDLVELFIKIQASKSSLNSSRNIKTMTNTKKLSRRRYPGYKETNPLWMVRSLYEINSLSSRGSNTYSFMKLALVWRKA